MSPVTLQIAHRRGICRVTCDGVFHGDYTRKLWANESAEEAARTLRKQGRSVEIAMLKGEGHQDGAGAHHR